ncbi:MAG: hypothetical protein ABN502_09725 [Gammaproteobacteria bacterium]
MDEIDFKQARNLLEAQIGHDLSLNLSGTVSMSAAVRAIATALRAPPAAAGVPADDIAEVRKALWAHWEDRLLPNLGDLHGWATKLSPVSAPEQRAVPECLESVLAELERAVRKFPTWPTDPLHALAVLGEEFGELTQAVLQATYEPHKSTPEDVAAEATQVAAMALRFLTSLSAYQYERSLQHQQDAAAQPQDEVSR